MSHALAYSTVVIRSTESSDVHWYFGLRSAPMVTLVKVKNVREVVGVASFQLCSTV